MKKLNFNDIYKQVELSSAMINRIRKYRKKMREERIREAVLRRHRESKKTILRR